MAFSLNSSLLELHKWSINWQMNINVEKCSVLHLGSKNSHCVYKINDAIIPSLDSCLDLGILVDNSLNFSTHIESISRRAYQRIAIFLKGFTSKDPKLLVHGFKVRPILEYCSSVWSPYLIKDIQSIENIQRFFTRKVLYKFDLEIWLSVLNLESLEYRRLKTDLVMYYKIIHNLIDLNCEDFFKFSRHSLTRSHNLTLTKPICKTNLYLNSFSNRLINVWNKLPIDVVNAPSLPSFVNSIKKIDFSPFLIF